MELALVRQEVRSGRRVTARKPAGLSAICMLLGHKGLFGFFFLLATASGCVPIKSLTLLPERPPIGRPCQIVATCNPEVFFAPDPVRNGINSPGLIVRLYLFGADLKEPVAGEGSFTVDLFDDTSVAEGREPVMLEQWNIDKDTARQLLRRDAVGWGYTLLLPWGTYRPDIRRVHLRLRYDGPQGLPLYTETNSLTLSHGPIAHPQVISRVGKPSS